MMHSQVYPYTEFCGASAATLPPSLNGPVVDCFVPTVTAYEEFIIGGNPEYEHLASKFGGPLDPYIPECPAYSPTNDNAFIDFTMPPLPMPMDNLPFSQELLWSPHPLGPPSPQNDTNSPSEPSCRQATPLADAARRKWYCSVCEEGFRNKHDCERHIDNVGKRARCKACKKTVCGRKDNRKRHYTKYCKSMDQREGLSLEEAFAEV